MKVMIQSNILKHKRDYKMIIYKNVRDVVIEHLTRNGNWLCLQFKEGSEEYEEYKNQKGILYIQYEITADLITCYEEI